MWVPFNQPGVNVGDLIDATAASPTSRIERPLMLALDPLLDRRPARSDAVLIVLLKVVVIFVIGLVGTMFMVWFERKVIAGMQNRIGPNKAGPFGMLQTLADGIKLFFKEDLSPTGPTGSCSSSRRSSRSCRRSSCGRVIPLGGDFRDGNDGIVDVVRPRRRRCSSPIRRSAILLVLALSSIAVYGIMLAGWSSGLEVPAARLGAGLGADGQLRGGARPQPRRRAADRRHAVSTSGIVDVAGRARRRGTSSPPGSCRSSSS